MAYFLKSYFSLNIIKHIIIIIKHVYTNNIYGLNIFFIKQFFFSNFRPIIIKILFK